jgi:bacteriocin-like protein
MRTLHNQELAQVSGGATTGASAATAMFIEHLKKYHPALYAALEKYLASKTPAATMPMV